MHTWESSGVGFSSTQCEENIKNYFFIRDEVGEAEKETIWANNKSIFAMPDMLL